MPVLRARNSFCISSRSFPPLWLEMTRLRWVYCQVLIRME